ncbi:MAG: amidohydrolase [Chloroflexi bacterium]|nr:amidohydrolase [Chloroflexota bacterium]
MPYTDTHAHIYSPDEKRYPMIPRPLRPPAGTGTIEHLRREMAANGIERVVAIHTSTAYEWDNRFISDSARANAPWMVGVCTLNPDDPASPELLRRYVADYNVRGMRSVPGAPNRSRLDHPGVDALWSMAEELGIVINVLIHVDLADQLEVMLRRHPELPVVLDHCMYPKAVDGLQGETLQRCLALSRYPNLYAKLTWLVDSSAQEYPFEDTYPLLRAVIDAYGPERCIWGSDFPTELWTPKATYTQAFRCFAQELGLTEAEKEAILSTTPGRLWFGE